MRDLLKAALAKGETLARESVMGHRLQLPADSPVKAPVYVLTDSICRSACLDFMDVLLKLPGLRHAPARRQFAPPLRRLLRAAGDRQAT